MNQRLWIHNIKKYHQCSLLFQVFYFSLILQICWIICLRCFSFQGQWVQQKINNSTTAKIVPSTIKAAEKTMKNFWKFNNHMLQFCGHFASVWGSACFLNMFSVVHNSKLYLQLKNWHNKNQNSRVLFIYDLLKNQKSKAQTENPCGLSQSNSTQIINSHPSSMYNINVYQNHC